MHPVSMSILAQFVRQFHLVDRIVGSSYLTITATIADLSMPPLPAVYSSFLATFGDSPSRSWFNGANGSLEGLRLAHDVHTDLAASPAYQHWLNAADFLPIMQHDGYVVYYLRLDTSDDPPVWCFVDEEESTKPPAILAPALSLWLQESALEALDYRYWRRSIPTASPRDTALMERYRLLYATFLQTYQTTMDAHKPIIDPWRLHTAWRTTLHQTDLYHDLLAHQQYIPFDWPLTPPNDDYVLEVCGL